MSIPTGYFTLGWFAGYTVGTIVAFFVFRWQAKRAIRDAFKRDDTHSGEV